MKDDKRSWPLYYMSKTSYFRLKRKMRKKNLFSENHICVANLGFAFIAQQGTAV
jgi:hypothetical protein